MPLTEPGTFPRKQHHRDKESLFPMTNLTMGKIRFASVLFIPPRKRSGIPSSPQLRGLVAVISLLLTILTADSREAESPPGTIRQTVEELPVSLAAKTDNLNDKFWLYLPKRYATAEEKLPLIIYLHGSSRRGRDIEQVKANGLPPVLDLKDDFDFVVASPQALSNYPWQVSWRPDDLILLLDHLLANYEIDPDRVYLTGLSMGGYGTWACIAKHPDRFAAAVPICGGGHPDLGEKIGDLPIWAFHGDDDFVVPVERSIEMVEAVNSAGGRARLTRYPGVGHDSYTQTYANPELYEWLLEQVRP